jgi:hypothetical protein
MSVRSRSGRDKLRAFFIANVGRTLTSHQLREVAGISEYARRIRELRDDEGMQIRTHRDRSSLKPDEYILESLDLVPIANRRIPVHLSEAAFRRDGPRCRICGLGWRDKQSPSRGSGFRLYIDYINPLEEGGLQELENVGVLCSTCKRDRDKARRAKFSAHDLLGLIRRAPPVVQREVYETMKRSFEREITRLK